VLGNSLAGYVTTSHGRRLVLAIAVGNVPIKTPEGFFGVVDDQAEMIESVYEHF
jgi:D-alanyl-D-alanine carboxypeptidase